MLLRGIEAERFLSVGDRVRVDMGQRRLPKWRSGTAENNKIYEGTNQIQRMVMARQLLR